jgi:hypothetical protein
MIGKNVGELERLTVAPGTTPFALQFRWTGSPVLSGDIVDS